MQLLISPVRVLQAYKTHFVDSLMAEKAQVEKGEMKSIDGLYARSCQIPPNPKTPDESPNNSTISSFSSRHSGGLLAHKLVPGDYVYLTGRSQPIHLWLFLPLNHDGCALNQLQVVTHLAHLACCSFCVMSRYQICLLVVQYCYGQIPDIVSWIDIYTSPFKSGICWI